jgi:plasmid stabilization system protein ParE
MGSNLPTSSWPNVQLKLARRAQIQVERMEAWWAAHRPAAPDLFAREFRDALQYILTTPGAGTPWPTPRRLDLKRVLMPRTKNHIYFRVEESGKVVHVLSVWGAPRGATPKL